MRRVTDCGNRPVFCLSVVREENASQAFNLMLFALVTVVCMLDSTGAYAANNCAVSVANFLPGAIAMPGLISPFCTAFGSVTDILVGNTGQVIATIGIIIAGLAALFGKVSWPQALVISAGVCLIYGAGSIMTGGNSSDTTLATDPNPITAVFKLIKDIMNSGTGRAIGMLCISILGIGAVYGKISWVQALTWMAGIGMVFGSAALVGVLWSPNAVSSVAMGVNILASPQLVTNLAIAGIANPAGIANFNGGLLTVDNVAEPFMNIIGLMLAPGGMGPAIGSVCVIALGVAAMLGKISWVRALLLVSGIALLFGAADVVYILSGPTSPCTQQSSDPFTQVICGFMDELQGNMAKTIGTLAVMVIGILSMLGKISWELALTVVVGIALIFGANALVGLFEVPIMGVTCSSAAPVAPNTGNAIADVLCYILLILYGPAGKALATVAVIMMGFGALMGKVSFSQAFVVAVGIAVMFGAPTVMAIIMPSANTSGCNLPVFQFGVGNAQAC